MGRNENSVKLQDLSHRAARRVIQRAVVLAGRDRTLRDHIRTVRVETLWRIEDADLTWTVVIDRGQLEYSRRPTKRPDVTLVWPALDNFAIHLESEISVATGEADFVQAQNPSARKAALSLYASFLRRLRLVLADPFDENGIPLIGQ
jgi:hypothetical protein